MGHRCRTPGWARWCVAVLVVAAGGTVAVTQYLITRATGAVNQQNLLGTLRAGTARTHASVTGAKNILLIGLDTRASDPDALSRSDTIILLHIPADHTQGYLVSLPRDSYVTIPAYNNGRYAYPGGKGKINAAYAFGSEGLTGAAAQSHGFEMYVDEDTTSIHIGRTASGKAAVPYVTHADGTIAYQVPGVTPNFYAKGNHCFTPSQALDFARQRDLLADHDFDYGRQRHQQQLLKAILVQAEHDGLASPAKLPGLLTAFGKTMTVDDGGVSLEDWAFAMKGVDPGRLVTIKTNDGKFDSRSVPGVGSVEILNDTSLQLLRAVRDDDVGTFMTAHPDWVASS